MVHYLDDILFAGPANTNICLHVMNTFDHVCQQFVVPISHEKSDGPTISITFYIFRPWHRHHQSVNIRAPDRVIALKVLLSSSIS